MSLLITLVIVLVIISLVAWLISSAPIPGPLAPTIRWALYAILIIFSIFYLLRLGGIHV